MSFRGLTALLMVSAAVVTSATAQAQAPTQQPAVPEASTPTPPPAVTPAAPANGTPAATTPAPASDSLALPPVEVIQQQPKPVQQAKPKAKAPQPAAQPAPAPPVVPQPPVEATAPSGPLPAGTVRISPVAGSEIAIDKVPGAVSIVSGSDVQRSPDQAITGALEQKVPSAGTNSALGNPLSNDLQFRGFTASPLNGTPQGLAVYQNGVRVNEVFGDATYWDLIPTVAISDIIVTSNNPVYGLNALGGAINVITKDGFSFEGVEIDGRLGSFGYKSGSVQVGHQVNNRWGAYLAAEYIDDDGWRDLSQAEAKHLFADIGAKGDGAEVHLNYTYAKSFLGVVGPTPIDLLNARRESVFTSPQSFDNEMHMVNLNGSVAVSDKVSVSGLAFYRSFRQRRPDGNVSEAIPCDPGGPDAGLLCFEENDDVLFGTRGETVSLASLPNGADTLLGGNDSVAVDSYSYGGALQAVSKHDLFNRPNQFLIGASIDLGKAHTRSQSELGLLDPRTLVVTGLGVIIDMSQNPDLDEGDVEVVPVDLEVFTQYYGLYFSNTLDVTDRLAVTVGGRYNLARIELDDQLGTDLDGQHQFERFNPMAGATYKVMPGLSIYGGYSESNRAPTPAELACADPARPCLLENFLVSDPPLKQVVGRTVEAGLRGEIQAGYSGKDDWGTPRFDKIGWSLGYFRTLLEDDIFTVPSPIQGRGFFINGGETLRQGLEAEINYSSDRLKMFASYALVEATFNTPIELASPDNPTGRPCTGFMAEDAEDEEPICVVAEKGDTIPGVPRHRIKAGFDYLMTPRFSVGADVIYTSSQYLRGDEGNDDAQIPGYAVVNARASYKVSDNMMIYGLVNNVFDTDYETFGTYFDTEALEGVRVGSTSTLLENPRTLGPAAPRAFYGGVRLRF